jgi:hypothetical protein
MRIKTIVIALSAAMLLASVPDALAQRRAPAGGPRGGGSAGGPRGGARPGGVPVAVPRRGAPPAHYGPRYYRPPYYGRGYYGGGYYGRPYYYGYGPGYYYPRYGFGFSVGFLYGYPYPWAYGGYGAYPYGYGTYPYGYGAYPYAYPSGYWGGYAGYPVQPYGGVRIAIAQRDAEVFVDGYFAGIVDDFDGTLQQINLEPGAHRIEIRAPGYQPSTFEVNVMPGRTVTYRTELR